MFGAKKNILFIVSCCFAVLVTFSLLLKIYNRTSYLISLQPARNDRYDKPAVPVHYSTNNNVLIHQRFVMINKSFPKFVIRDFIFTAPEHIDNYHHTETNMLHRYQSFTVRLMHMHSLLEQLKL